MPDRTSEARWEGTLKEGKGVMKFGSGAYEGAYSFPSRFESGDGTNPEELIAAAHAGCYSMALSAGLGKAGFTPTSVDTKATVTLEAVEGGFGITKISLVCEAVVPDIDDAKFQELATATKSGCPVSKALAGPEISLSATLK
ncbi:MAG: OsmC family peroxiredoxin [Nitrospinaceae bacterium]|nr:OsmC family protein [Nitrospinaceae bacterium]NIR54708.1 OsmC family protein [Nitrospinaceae bacterium]NIS85129.1 OsmC family protein [Nitrospinaceae bacterium]NIT81946.1 OsmC family protein [Nitrospinaceae bacterium]NIU44207.1 OsmC family protein [Nitrospinaceae bacterium]